MQTQTFIPDDVFELARDLFAAGYRTEALALLAIEWSTMEFGDLLDLFLDTFSDQFNNLKIIMGDQRYLERLGEAFLEFVLTFPDGLQPNLLPATEEANA